MRGGCRMAGRYCSRDRKCRALYMDRHVNHRRKRTVLLAWPSGCRVDPGLVADMMSLFGLWVRFDWCTGLCYRLSIPTWWLRCRRGFMYLNASEQGKEPDYQRPRPQRRVYGSPKGPPKCLLYFGYVGSGRDLFHGLRIVAGSYPS
jgi:hypothetical protein